MLCDLIIDGNFLLNKLVFTLHKNNLLFGALHKGLETSVLSYRKWYPFANVYLVSDSREKSWRKNLDVNYKANRRKDSDIDWEFVFEAYNEFKDTLKLSRVKILESPTIEGDDWISFLTERANLGNRSTIIISNDYDIKQLVKYSTNPLYINIMSNEMFSKQKLFLPANYQIFLDTINKLDNNDIFNLNDNQDFINLLHNFIKRYDITEINPIESLIIKIISGDISDNIPSSWSVTKNGKRRGIAERGAKSIFDEYINNFGYPSIDDPDLTENIADLICEKKKLSISSIPEIKKNLENNMKLIILDTNKIPSDILNKMKSVYEYGI